MDVKHSTRNRDNLRRNMLLSDSSSSQSVSQDSSCYSDQDSVESLDNYNRKCSPLDIRNKLIKRRLFQGSENEAESISPQRDDKLPCRYCKRRFFKERIEKHENACQNASKKRPVFDIKCKRAPNLVYPVLKRSNSIRKPTTRLNFPDSKWQRQHSDFQNNIKFARKLKYLEEAGIDVTHIRPPPAKNEDYIQCPYCFRKYAPIPAERHIPKCKDIIHKPRPLPNLKIATGEKLPMISLRENISKTRSHKTIITCDRAYSDSTKAQSRNMILPDCGTPKNERTTLRSKFTIKPIYSEQVSLVNKSSSQHNLSHVSSKLLPKPLTPILKSEPSSATYKLPSKLNDPSPSADSKLKPLSRNNSSYHRRQLTGLKNTDQNFRIFGTECKNCMSDLPVEANFCMICGKARYI